MNSDFLFFFLLRSCIFLLRGSLVLLHDSLNVGEKCRSVDAASLVQLSNHYFLASSSRHAQMSCRSTNLAEVFHLCVHDFLVIVHVDFGEANLGRAALLLELK